MTPNFPFQQKLFDHIDAHFKNKKAELDMLVTFFQLSRSAAYDRRSGKTPLTFDEGLALAKTYKFPLANFLPEIVSYPTISSPSSFENSPKEYVQALHFDLHKLLTAGSPQLWHKTDDTPLFWLKYSRLLAGFKLYYWFRALAVYKNEKPPDFDQNWLAQPHIKEILDLSREIRQCMEQIPSTEIWSPNMFDKTMAQVKDCIDTSNINDPSIAHELALDLKNVIEIMKNMVRSRKKGLDGKGASLTVFENRTFSGSNLLIGRTDEYLFAYVENGYPDFNRLLDKFPVDNQLRRVELMLPHLSQIGGFSHTTQSFFDDLDDHYDFWKTKLARAEMPQA